MTHSAGPPPPGRRRPGLWHWLGPRSSRTVVPGMCTAVGGLAGKVRCAVDGRGIWTTLGVLGAGILGVLVVVRCFVGRADR